MLCASHQSLRTAYGIHGSCLGDCVASTACCYCAQLQQAREVQIHKSAAAAQTMMVVPMVVMAAPQPQQQAAYVVAR